MAVIHKAVFLALLLGAVPATAQQQDKLFDATDPKATAAALMSAGYKAVLKESDGDPYIESATNGQTFSIDFYGFKDGHCSSFQFESWYKPDPLWTPALANKWNIANRFLRIAVNDKGELHEYMDVTGVGKLTQANFADAVDWYQTMDGELAKFIDKAREAAKPDTPKK